MIIYVNNAHRRALLGYYEKGTFSICGFLGCFREWWEKMV